MRFVVLLLALVAAPSVALAGDFVDTRLVFIAGDDDFLHNAGESVPPSPQFDLADRAGYTRFFDRLDGEESGRESRTHLVLHKGVKGYFPGLFTEAALVLELNHTRLLAGDPRALGDDGTFLRLKKNWGESALSATFMPFSSDRLRLGWLWGVTWGGEHIFPNAELTPGMQIAFEQPMFDVHLGFKTARIQFESDEDVPQRGQIEAFFGVFGGVGVGKKEGLRGELQGGYFDKGNNPRGPVAGEPIDAGGVSARISYVSGMPFEPGDDTRLYTKDALRPWNSQAGPRGWRVAAEASYVGQVLEDPDLFGGTVTEEGMAWAVYGQARYRGPSFSAKVLGRDLGFLFFDSPGVVTRFQAVTDAVEQNPEMVATLGYEHHIASMHLNPGVTVGAQMPASVSNSVPPAGIITYEPNRTPRTELFRRADMFDDSGVVVRNFLPEGEEALPIFGLRLHTRLDLAAGFALQAEVSVMHDANRTLLQSDALGVNTSREFADATTVGGSLMARAEF